MDLSTIIRDKEKAVRFINDNFISNENEPALDLLDDLFGLRINRMTSPVAIARAFGHPYDPHRLSLFEKLFVELQQRSSLIF